MLGLAGPSGTGVGRRPEADSCWPADQGDGAQNYWRTTFERDEVAARAEKIDEIDEQIGIASADSGDASDDPKDEDRFGDPSSS